MVRKENIDLLQFFLCYARGTMRPIILYFQHLPYDPCFGYILLNIKLFYQNTQSTNSEFIFQKNILVVERTKLNDKKWVKELQTNIVDKQGSGNCN